MMIESIGIYVANQIASYAISKGLDKLFTNRNSFERRLAKVIDQSIDEYHNKYPTPDEDGKFPFYKSQLFVEELLKLRFFGDTSYKIDESTIISQISKNKNIIPPKREQLSDFLEIFEKQRKADDELKNLEIEENYKKQIFRNTDKLDQIIELLKQYGGIAGSPPKELTARIPKVSQDRIIGRNADLNDLHDRLFNNRQVVLVNGLGGIGKTAVAQVYVSKYWDEYHHIAWITQTSGDIMSNIITTEGLLDVLNISREGQEPKDLFINIVTAFKKFEIGPNLLIIDNADNSLSQLYDYLPGQPLWHILVTSREKIQKFDLKELDFLSEDDAVSLFLTHYTHGNIPEDEIKELIKTVDYHTLTIEILAKTAQLQRTDINKLKKAIEEDLKANVYIDHKGDKIEKVTSYLSSIFSLSDLNENEIWLMKQFVCLPSEFLNYQLLKDLIKPEAHQKEDVFSETLEELATKGWLLNNQETDSYKLHNIIAEVCKNKLSITPNDVEPLIDSVCDKLRIDYTKDNPVTKFKWIPFGKSIVYVFYNREDNIIGTVQNYLALVLKEFGDYIHAKEYLEKAVEISEKKYGSENPTTIFRYSNLALVLKDMGDIISSKRLFEKVMSFDEKHYGAEHPATAMSYSNMANVLTFLGDYSGAKEFLEKAVRINETAYGTNHPTTSGTYSNLANVLQSLGNFLEAKRRMEQSVEINERIFGIEHPTTADSYTNLATILSDLGDIARAKILQEKSIRIIEQNFGVDHPKTINHYLNLGIALQDLGDYSKAKEILEKAVKLAENKFGDQHPTTVKCYLNLANVLHSLADYGVSKEILEKVVSFTEKSFGADHPMTGLGYSNLGLVHQSIGDYAAAKELLERAVNSATKCYGPQHLTTAVRYINLAVILRDLNDTERALKLAIKALDIFQKELPQDHPKIKLADEIYKSINSQID